jgi:hypothetical protein
MPATARAFIARLFGAAALSVAAVMTVFAAYALCLGLATLSVEGLACSLAYCVLCLPALPLFLLGRRVWGKAGESIESRS